MPAGCLIGILVGSGFLEKPKVTGWSSSIHPVSHAAVHITLLDKFKNNLPRADV
jgi:hypothetical protein